MDGIDDSEAQIREANELYWESDTSVNRIADQLGLSKGSLYAAIEPLASGSLCPLCSARLVYMNRTALEKGHLQCSDCGTEFSEKARSGSPQPMSAAGESAPAEPTSEDNGVGSTREPGQEEPAAEDGPAPYGHQNEGDSTLGSAERVDAPQRASRQLVLSTTMLGLGVGLLLARVLRR